MTDFLSGVFNWGGSTVSGVSGFVMDQWGSRLGQVAFAAAVLYWVFSSQYSIDALRKMIPGVSAGPAKIMNAALFGFFLFMGMKIVFDPFVSALSQEAEKNGSVQ